MIVEILGIRGSNYSDKWWGPDGSDSEIPDNFSFEPISNDKIIFQIAWDIIWPKDNEQKPKIFMPKGAKDHRSGHVRDKYGNEEGIMISVYDTSNQKADSKAGIRETEGTYQYAIFENISFIPGTGQGFKIEVKEAEEK